MLVIQHIKYSNIVFILFDTAFNCYNIALIYYILALIHYNIVFRSHYSTNLL